MQLAIRFPKKSCVFDMPYPLTNIHADFEINRLIRYQTTAKRNYLHRRQTDGRTDGRTDGQTWRTTTIGSFFRKKKKILKTVSLITQRSNIK